MKKLILPALCLVIGCAAGTTLMPTLAAQPVAPSAAATPRWEQRCQLYGGIGNGDRRAEIVGNMSDSVNRAGADGWENVAAPVQITGSPRSTWSDIVICFKRPRPAGN